MPVVAELSVVKVEADYGGLVRAPKPSSSGYLTSVSECLLRAANMEDTVTERSTFNDRSLTEGLFMYSVILFQLTDCDCYLCW